MSRESKLVKNTAILGIGMMCTRGISFFLLPLYTALLTTEEYGIVDLIITIASLITYTVSLQFEQGIFRYLIDCRDNEEEKKKYISTTVFTMAVTLTIGLSLTGLVVKFTGYGYLMYILLNIAATLYSQIFGQIARGLGYITRYTISNFLSAAGNIVFNVIFIVGLNWHVEGMLTATIIGQMLAGTFAFFSSKSYKYISFKYFDKVALGNLLRFSLPMVPNTLCWWVVNVSDRFIISFFFGPALNGIYAVANKFPSLFTTITNVFQVSWTENASESSNLEDRDKYYSKIMNQSMCFMTCICAGIIVILPLLFNYLINNKFHDAYPHVMILLVAGLMHTWGALYGSLFSALKYTTYIAKTTVYAAIINIVVNLAFIHFIGLYAASISTLLSYTTIAYMRHREICKVAKISYNLKQLSLSGLMLAIAVVTYLLDIKYVSAGATVIVAIYSFLANKVMIMPLINKFKKRK